MQTFLGMILGALLLVAGVYVYDSQATSTVANGQTASNSGFAVDHDALPFKISISMLMISSPAACKQGPGRANPRRHRGRPSQIAVFNRDGTFYKGSR